MPTPPDDELTRGRAKRAEVQAKLEQGGDAESCDYWRKVIAEWDKYIIRLEAKHGREATVQAEHRPGEFSARGD